MTWPNTQVSTQHLDSGTDNPGLARSDLKSAVDNINSVVSEFGNVNTASATEGQVLTRVSNVWTGSTPTVYGNTQVAQYLPTFTGVQNLTRYQEPVTTLATTTGAVTVSFADGNQHILNMTGNVTLGFTAAPVAGTITIVANTGASSRSITFANTVRYAGNIRSISTTTNTIDVIVATTVDSGSTYLVSIVKGFVL